MKSEKSQRLIFSSATQYLTGRAFQSSQVALTKRATHRFPSLLRQQLCDQGDALAVNHKAGLKMGAIFPAPPRSLQRWDRSYIKVQTPRGALLFAPDAQSRVCDGRSDLAHGFRKMDITRTVRIDDRWNFHSITIQRNGKYQVNEAEVAGPKSLSDMSSRTPGRSVLFIEALVAELMYVTWADRFIKSRAVAGGMK
jgi:hypothetical protein